MPLSGEEIEIKLSKLPDWSYHENSLIREFSALNFSSALSFVVQIGIEAEKLEHHPDILLHSWNKILVKLSTHSEGRVSEKDFLLAEAINKLVRV